MLLVYQSTFNTRVIQFEQRLSTLLDVDISDKHKKERAFVKRLIKNRKSFSHFYTTSKSLPITTVRKGA